MNQVRNVFGVMGILVSLGLLVGAMQFTNAAEEQRKIEKLDPCKANQHSFAYVDAQMAGKCDTPTIVEQQAR